MLELGDRQPRVPVLTPPLTDRQLFWVPAFYCCDKMPEKNNLKPRFILTHGGRGFNPWPAGFMPCDKAQNIMAEGCGRGSYSGQGDQKAERRKGLEQDKPFR